MATDESFERDNGFTDTVKAVLASSSSSSSPSIKNQDHDPDDALDYNEAFPQLTSYNSTSDSYRGFPLLPSTEFERIHQQGINTNGSTNSAKPYDDDLRRKLAVHEKLATTKIIEIPLEERRIDKAQRQASNSSSNRGAAVSMNNNSHIQKFCTKLQKETSCTITFLYKEQTLIVTVTGRPEQVRHAQVQINQELQRPVKETVEIPASYHGYILGPRAATLRQVEQETMTRIAVPSQESGLNGITITGAKDNVKLAAQKITSIFHAQFNKGYERLPIPALYHPWIRNELVDELKRQYNVIVSLPPPNKQIDEISIRGERQPVELAKNRVLQYFRSLEGKILEFPLDIPCSQHRFILGKKGAGLKAIFDQTNAFVRIPNQEENSTRIFVAGESSRIGEAITLIYKMANEKTAVKIQSPEWMHAVVKGDRSGNIEVIRQKYPDVRIYFRDDDIDIEGPPEQVEPVRSQIQTVIDDLRNNNTTYLEIDIDPQYYSQLIGKNGMRLEEIENQTGCDIKFPQENSRIVKLMGTKEGVEKARSILLDRVQKMANERTVSVTIDRQFHPQLIGSKGKKIEELRTKFHNIHIHIPTANENSDKVVLQGDKEDVEKCVKFLQQKIKEFHSIEFHVARRIYPSLIGKSGTRIQRIRDAVPEVRIEITTLEENSETFQIRLSGRKAEVENAKKMLDEKIAEITESLENTLEQTIKIDRKWHGRFLQSNKKLLIDIQKQFGDFNMKLPDKNEPVDEIVIRGGKAIIVDVEKHIYQLIDEWENRRVQEIEIPSRHHGYLLAQNGMYVKNLEKEFNVRIQFPSREKENGQQKEKAVRISGRDENVQKASEALEKMVPTEETLEIPNEVHGTLVGRNGSHLNELIELYPDVQITFPPIKSQSNTIHLKGQRDQVEKFRKELLDRYEKYRADKEARSFEIRLTIEGKYRPLIIGSRRRKITDLKQKYEVSIQIVEQSVPSSAVVPATSDTNKDDEQNENKPDDQQAIPEDPSAEDQTKENHLNRQDCDLIIRGYERKVVACRDEILQLINDFQSKITMEIEIDRRVHARIIGSRGQNLKDLMKKYSVEIRFPSKNSNQAYVSGSDEQKIQDCIDELLLLEEEYSIDLPVREKPSAMTFHGSTTSKYPQQEVPSSNRTNGHAKDQRDKQAPFKVKNAPWGANEIDGDHEEFRTKSNGTSQSSKKHSSAPNPNDLGAYPSFVSGSSKTADENEFQTVKSYPVRWGPPKSNKK